MSLETPIRFDRFQAAVTAVLDDAVGADADVALSFQEPSQQMQDPQLVTFSITNGPTPVDRHSQHGFMLNTSSQIDIEVDSVVVGKRYIVRLNRFDYFTDAIGGDTVDTIRDRLRDAINNDLLETATAAAGASGILELTEDVVGGMQRLFLFGPLSCSSNTLSGSSVLVSDIPNRMLVTFQAFSKNTSPRGGAWAMISRVGAVFQSRDYLDTLKAAGFKVWGRSTPVNLSAIAGGRWESRVSLDLVFTTRATWVRPANSIESMSTTITLLGAGAPINVTA